MKNLLFIFCILISSDGWSQSNKSKVKNTKPVKQVAHFIDPILVVLFGMSK